MADDATPKPSPAAPSARPTRPDEEVFKKALAEAEKAHKASMDRLNAIRAKIEVATPNRNKDQPGPAQLRRQELISKANEIRQKQAGGKTARSAKLEQIKRLDEQVRSRVAEQKSAKSRIPHKNVEEIDRQIALLEAQVNSGTMKLVDEKKALGDMSNLRKMRKSMGQLDEAQKQIDDLRANIKDLKDAMDDPEQKALSDQYAAIQTELDALKAEQDEAYKGLSTLRDERSRLHKEQQEAFAAIRKLKDDFYGRRKAYQAFEREAREKQRERRKAEHEQHLRDRKKAMAERTLAEASDPAYLEEMRRANSLLQFLDPTHRTAEKSPLVAGKGLGAQPQRTVDPSGLQGTKLVRKEDREEEYLPALKKGKKGKKSGKTENLAATTTTSTTASPRFFSCPPSVVEDCAFIGLDPPMASDDVPGLIEKVRAKLAHWKADQADQTRRNIEKAKKEIEKLEKEMDDQEANGAVGAKDTSPKVEGITASLQEASLATTE